MTRERADGDRIRAMEDDEEETVTLDEQIARDVGGVDDIDPLPLGRRRARPRRPRAKTPRTK